MRKAFTILILGVSLIAARAANVIVTITDYQSQPVTNIKCIVTCFTTPSAQAGSVSVIAKNSFVTDGTGAFTIQNAVAGNWSVSPQTNNAASFAFTVPLTNATLRAENLLSVPTNSPLLIAWTAAADLRYDPLGSVNASSVSNSLNAASVATAAGGSILTNTETGVTLTGTFFGNIAGAYASIAADVGNEIANTLAISNNYNGTFTGNGNGLTNLSAASVAAAGGVTNGQKSVSFGFNPAIQQNAMPAKWFGFGDSLMQNLRTNGWFSQGGFSNQYVQGPYTNSYLFYPVGSYPTNNLSIVDGLAAFLFWNNNIGLSIDLAGAVPGQKGSDIYALANGISLTSLQATMNTDQTHGFTYNSSGVSTAVVHGDPFPLTFWPSANDTSFVVQGTTYTVVGATPIQFTVTGTSYVSITFNGVASAVSTAKITLPYRAGQGSVTKYDPPYTSACNAFNLTGNIAVSVWALSNAPSTTGVPAGAIIMWGNNDSNLTTNDLALWSNQSGYADYLHQLGFFPVVLISTSVNPNSSGATLTTFTNLINDQRMGWTNHYDKFFDLQALIATNALWGQSTNFIDNTHWVAAFGQFIARNWYVANGFYQIVAPAAAQYGSMSNFVFSATNTLTVAATGVTNFTSQNYLLSVTVGTGMALKDANGNQFATPVATGSYPLRPGWQFTGSTITATAIQSQ